MSRLSLEGVHSVAAERVRPFLEELMGRFAGLIRSVYVTGSAVTADFDERTSDVNSLLIVRDVTREVLGGVAKLGRKYRRRRVGAPLMMTERDIERSLDVFPVEFLDLKLVNRLVVGEELLADLTVERSDMRMQCERELKGRIIRLRQDYIRSLGDRDLLHGRLAASVAGLVPLLRGVLYALGHEAPRERAAILAGLHAAAACDTAPLEAVIRLKAEARKPPLDALSDLLMNYLRCMVKLADVVDASD